MVRSIIIIPNTNLIINGSISRSDLPTKNLPKAELSGAARRRPSKTGIAGLAPVSPITNTLRAARWLLLQQLTPPWPLVP